ncbi:MAG: hypothetical protein GY854_11935, partial [Deltaproteobacteria bacterium]|nr:hypothetical protein [Deltaproteobacteria bacterium]
GYLEKRGLRSSEIVERFMLGYCDRSLGPLLPNRDRKAGRDLRRRLIELGILAKSGHERLRGSITIPIFDESGHVAQVYGRKAGVRLRKGTDLHTWLDDGRRGVWNLPAFQVSTEIVLCKSLMDALSFWCAGLRNVTAVSRTGETADLREAFERHDTERVLLAFDDTDIADTLIADGLEVHRVEFPHGDDANDYLRNTGFGGLKQAIQAARRIGESPDPRGDIWRDPGSMETPDREGDIRHEERAPEASSGASERALEMDSFSGIPDTSNLDVEIRSLAPNAPSDTKPDEVVIRFGDRRWRVRGLERNLAFNSLKVNLLVSCVQGDRIESFHIDTFDLYSARHRNAFSKQAAEELGVKDGVIRR